MVLLNHRQQLPSTPTTTCCSTADIRYQLSYIRYQISDIKKASVGFNTKDAKNKTVGVRNKARDREIS